MMRYPVMNTRARRTVVIPDLAGGMNLRESLSSVNDNQMTDCKNMWFKDGLLRTRPALKSSSNEVFAGIELECNFKIFPDVRFEYEGEQCYLAVSITDEPTNTNTMVRNAEVLFISETDASKRYRITQLLEDASVNSRLRAKDTPFIAYKHQNNAYLLIAWADELFEVYSIDLPTGKTTRITDEDRYAPLVFTNCLYKEGLDVTGTQVSGYNLLGGYAKIEYSTVNQAITPVYGENSHGEQVALYRHLMMYRLPNLGYKDEDRTLFEGKTITAEIIDKNGNVNVHRMTIQDGGQGAEVYDRNNPPSDGLIMMGDYSVIEFRNVGDDGDLLDIAKIGIDDVQILNNMTITFPVDMSKERKKVFNMTRSIWFGGGGQGIYGGSRLFLGGNINESEKSLVIWSDVNNPLYFPENNYAYVGDKTQAVTAFGRQADTLVIFKEREVYQTQYVYNSSVTAEDLMNQSVIDLAAQTVTFPMYQVHGCIGCDCPDTVQLCRNRLVWANSNGKIYTLVSQNQYNERAVLEVSQMIERRLKKEVGLGSALSADYDGHYMLFVGNRVYVMDYNSYGYSHIYSYSKSEDANMHIPWYCWELPISPTVVYKGSKDIFFPIYLNKGEHINTEGERTRALVFNIFCFDGTYGNDVVNTVSAEFDDNGYVHWTGENEVRGIESSIQTKLFDFGVPGYYKTVDSVNFSLGNNGGVPIEVCFVTDKGTEEDEIILECGETESYTPEYLSSASRFPCITSVMRFGVKISCVGPLAIDGMTLTYRILGGVR